MVDLKELRKDIDIVDAELLTAFRKRFEITEKIGEYKAETNAELFCPEREEEKLDDLRKKLNDSEYAPYIVDLYKCIMDYSKYQQSNNIFGTKDIFLIGMPGCGKTTIGRLLADKMQRNFIDMDILFENTYKISPAKMIEDKGEAFFRDSETELLKKIVLKPHSQKDGDTIHARIISCGGGIVCRDDNKELLKTNSIVCYIKRDLAKLTVKGRPLSQKNGIAALYDQRKEKYESWCDHIIENDRTPNECADRIISHIKEDNK
ncbi:MAG: chorismate mutase [Lachnospiraceae bacterium]|nr:chorismate mutase [Lachnospiraceae bacterium]